MIAQPTAEDTRLGQHSITTFWPMRPSVAQMAAN
jgi:hypothetical protein